MTRAPTEPERIIILRKGTLPTAEALEPLLEGASLADLRVVHYGIIQHGPTVTLVDLPPLPEWAESINLAAPEPNGSDSDRWLGPFRNAQWTSFTSDLVAFASRGPNGDHR